MLQHCRTLFRRCSAHSNDLLQRRCRRLESVYWYQLSYSVAASWQQSTSRHYHTSFGPTKCNASVQTPHTQTLHCPWSSFIAATCNSSERDGDSCHIRWQRVDNSQPVLSTTPALAQRNATHLFRRHTHRHCTVHGVASSQPRAIRQKETESHDQMLQHPIKTLNVFQLLMISVAGDYFTLSILTFALNTHT